MTNISPEIAEALEEGRKNGIRESARLISDIFEVKDNKLFNGIWRTVDEDGWGPLKSAEEQFKNAILRYLAKHINEDPVSINKEKQKAIEEKYAKIVKEQRL